MPIEILPESDNETLCLRYSGVITAEEFTRCNHLELKKRADKNGFFNMLIVYDEGYEGWEPDAADLNFKSIAELHDKPKKLAYVNPDNHKILLMKLTQPMMHAQIRYFQLHELNDAIAWVKQ